MVPLNGPLGICPSALAIVFLLLAACSPEAERVRDGGAGADPGNKDVVEWRGPEPRAADTTLWPARNTTPVERLARGQMPPPAGVAAAAAPARRGDTPVTPDVPASAAEQRTFDKATSADPRRPSARDSTPARTP